MFKYQLKNLDTNDIMAVVKTPDDIENPWADKFAKFDVFGGMHEARPEILDGEEIVQTAREKNFEIIKENIDAELQLIEDKKVAKESAKLVAKYAKKALQAVKTADNLNKLQKATEDLAKVVHALVKCLDLVDPTEGE